MKINKKLLGFGTLALPIVVAASMFFAMNPNMNLLNKAFAGDGTSDYSITFNRTVSEYTADTTNKIYTSKSNTSSGNSMYLVATKCANPTATGIATVPNSFDSVETIPVLRFYNDSSRTNQYRCQGVLSLFVTTSRTITLTVKASSDGTNFYKKGTFSSSTSGGTYSSFDKFDRYIEITVDSDNRPTQVGYIREVVFSYSCNSSYVPSSFTEGSFAGKVINNASVETDISIEFNSDKTGFYYYKNTSPSDGETYKTAFTWSYNQNKENITITYATGGTGNNTAYQGCRILFGFSAGKTNTIALVDDSVSVFLYKEGSASSIWETPTIMSK